MCDIESDYCRYCLFCAPVINTAQRCLLCLNSESNSYLPPKLPSPQSVQKISSNPSMFNEIPRHNQGDIGLSVPIEQTFSIWNPITPKSSSQSQNIAAINNNNGNNFSLPPPLMAQTLNWPTASRTEIQASFDQQQHQQQKRTFLKCTMCAEENSLAKARCIQCGETLCSECVAAHHRVRMTRDHTLIGIETCKGFNLTSVASGNELFNLDDVMDNETCGTHDAPMLCKCTICIGIGLCYMCVMEHPKHHQLMALNDLRASINLLINNSKHDQKNIEDAVETVRRMGERVEASVQSVMRELRSVIHMHISALEQRKCDLLQRLDTIRQSKMSVLKAQGERLTSRLTSLNDVLKAAELVVSSSSDGNDVHLCSTFDSLLNIVREQNVHLIPNETDLLKLIPPDDSFINRLRSLCELESGACARTTHLIGDSYKRAIRDRMSVVEVQTRDACGDACISSSHSITANVTAPDGHPLQVHINEREGGIYAVSYYPIEEGNHTLDILIRGLSISGCPSLVQVRKGRNYAELARTGPIFSFGREGSEDGQFARPWGICCDHKGRIIVADRSNNRIQIFDKDGKFLMKFGTAGGRSGQFNRPAGIAVNSMNEIVVADKDNHRIQVFNEGGEFLLKFGERGRAPGMFNYPWGVAINAYNQIAVSDTRNHRVQIFSPQGHYLRKCGFDSSLFYKNLDSPRGVCFLPDSRLIITDFNNHRLVVVSSHGPSEIQCYGSEGDGDRCFCRPQGITVDSEGNILVCDSRNNRVQVLNVEDMNCVATFGGVISSSASKPACSTPIPSSTANAPPTSSSSGSHSSTGFIDTTSLTLNRPTDVCVSPDGTIYVVDFGSNCIRVY
ncbi:unnamed protein product [Anisakis simplex]|uniref:B box-type domain-containing protein n=1 Tax=Anisakis simplex TaxID=6269 RepID=A0A0M3JRY8_ANISI|nr:unnamed protein product [Anisakis simplex]